jgi:hypothetical protein
VTEEDWALFIASGSPLAMGIARLPTGLCRALGASTNLVRVRHDYTLKMTQKHKLEPRHFPMLPVVLERGRVIANKQHHLTFFHNDHAGFGSWFQVTLKTNRAGDELWVATFHGSRGEEVDRYSRRHGILRPEKE